MDDFSSTVGVVALVGCALGAVSLLCCLVLALRDVVDVVVQRTEAVLQLRCECDEIALAAVAEHRALGGAQPAKAQDEHEAAQQRQRGECAADEGDDADGAAEVVHVPLEGTGGAAARLSA